MKSSKFWLYLEIELRDLLGRFERCFSVSNLYTDYENVWEWIESKNRDQQIYLNVSRSHNWSNGEYEKPIVILVENLNGSDLTSEAIGQILVKEFRTKVFQGEISIDRHEIVQNIKKVYDYQE